MQDAEELLLGLLDAAIRALCPKSQSVQREAYRPIMDESILRNHYHDEVSLECETLQDYFDLFALLGIPPHCWTLFVDAVVWTMKTHAPYAQSDDLDDLELPAIDSAWGRFVAVKIAMPAIEAKKSLSLLHKDPIVMHLQQLWDSFDHKSFAELFYSMLFEKHPQFKDFFPRTDTDTLRNLFILAMDLVIHNVRHFGDSNTSFRSTLNRLGETLREMNIPTYAYALVGEVGLDCFEPFFQAEEQATKNSQAPILAEDLHSTLAQMYSEIMSIVYYPMLREEKLLASAKEFYGQLKDELGWSRSKLEARVLEIEGELHSTGQYTQTTEELEMGARLAWRNSAKCIGRISWNTLQVRDRRHVKDPEEIFLEVERHLFDATAGAKIQSVMTVFQPQSLNEPFGMRFWSSQIIRYAAYKDHDTGKITGDPANLDLTNYLISNEYWSPPDEISPFDVLPLVLKLPGKSKPIIHELPKDCIFDVRLEHPTNEKLSELGYRWTSIPALSDFKMNLGGIIYQNIPFNGWFVSTEIVRNLMERYNVGPEIAKAMGIDTETNPVWRNEVFSELEKMVIYSFRKNGRTIVDPMTAGESFCTHVRREREQHGRECPAQWSWIGGLLGPTNPTWHLEMRDFRVDPQYHYCAKGMLLHTALGPKDDINAANRYLSVANPVSSSSTDSAIKMEIPQVLIAYGSETGNAESIARDLARTLRLMKPVLVTLEMAKGLVMADKLSITHVICICSTFGNGDPPANAKDFFGTKITPSLPGRIQFAVLALGSSVYPDFCQAGVELDTILSETAGLERFAELTKVDDVSGFHSTIAAWKSMITRIIFPPSVEKYLREQQSPSLHTDDVDPTYSFIWLAPLANLKLEKEPVERNALCVSNEELLPPETSRSVRRITFEGIGKYETGDHVSVAPLNSEDIVSRFLNCFKQELDSIYEKEFCQTVSESSVEWMSKQPFYIQLEEQGEVVPLDTVFKVPTTLEHALRSKLDLGFSKNYVPGFLVFIKRLFEEETLHCLHASVRNVLIRNQKVQKLLAITGGLDNSKMSEENVQSFLASYPLGLVDFLEDFQSILLESYFGESPILGLAELMVNMNRLQPRCYSISSSNNISPKELSLTVGILNNGVCSNYLAGLTPGIDRASISVRPSSFRLPKDSKAPIIIVCAGTGLAPIVGFLQEKLEEKKKGSCARDIFYRKRGISALECEDEIAQPNIVLFYGCQTCDFIYKDFLLQLVAMGLIKLHLALSRVADADIPKQYVQDKILEVGEETSNLLLREDAHYYVCGNASMANSCYESCITILHQYHRKSRLCAAQHLKRMRAQGRWQSDVWGVLKHYEENSTKNVRESKRRASKILKEEFRRDSTSSRRSSTNSSVCLNSLDACNVDLEFCRSMSSKLKPRVRRSTCTKGDIPLLPDESSMSMDDFEEEVVVETSLVRHTSTDVSMDSNGAPLIPM